MTDGLDYIPRCIEYDIIEKYASWVTEGCPSNRVEGILRTLSVRAYSEGYQSAYEAAYETHRGLSQDDP